MPHAGPKPKFLRLLLFTFLPALIVWALLETSLLLFYWLGLAFVAEPAPLLALPHPYRTYTHVPHSTDRHGKRSHDAFGLRRPEVSPVKSSDTIRIACIGGSTTYGIAATTDTHTYPAHLERFLASHYRGKPFSIEVINAGFPGYSSLESLILFQTLLLNFEPHIAIFQTCVNDVWNAVLFEEFASDYLFARRTMAPAEPGLWEYSPLMTLLFEKHTSLGNPYRPAQWDNLMRLIAYPQNVSAHEHSWWLRRRDELTDTVERNLISMIAVARGNGILPVLATETHIMDYTPFAFIVEAGNERIRQVAQAENVPLVDCSREMPWSADLFPDNCHLRDVPGAFDRKGRIFADALVGAGVIEETWRNPSDGTGAQRLTPGEEP